MSPVSPALAENLAAEVVGHYQEAERQLLERISRNLAKGIDGPHWAEEKYTQLLAYQKQTERLIADLRVKAKTGVDTAITTAYERGGLSAVADMNAMGVTAVEPLAGLRAVEAMAAETLGYVNATHPRILRSTMDAYRAAIEAGSKQAFVGSMERVAASEAARTIVAENAQQVLLGAQTRRQATQAALNAFAKKGITGFIDKSGRGWNLESYVETAMRTGCGKAAVQGHVDRLTANGLNLVIVSDAPRECPLCRPWEGKVLSIGSVPVEMPEDMDPAFKVDSEVPTSEGQTPQAVKPEVFDARVLNTEADYRSWLETEGAAKMRKAVQSRAATFDSSQASSAAVSFAERYKGAGWDELNTALRATTSDAEAKAAIRDAFAFEIKRGDFKAEHIENAFDLWWAGSNSVTGEALTSYRVAGGELLDYVDGHFDDIVGSVIEDKAFMSTSLVKEWTKDWGDGVAMEIRMAKGTHGILLDEVMEREEFELLLNRGSKLKVIAAERVGKSIHLITELQP